MKEIPKRRIIVTSSLNEISANHLVHKERVVVRGRGERYSARHYPSLQQASGQIFKDDVNSFSPSIGYFLRASDPQNI
jgi:hypothetical protein